MSNYEQRFTDMPSIEVVPRETLSEKQCYHLEHLLVEVTFKYLHHIGIDTPGVTCRRNTGINPFAPLDFRDECGMSVVGLSDLWPLENNDKMQELKDSILGRMQEFMDEYHGYSKSTVDYFGAKEDAMETAMKIVEGAFSDFVSQLN